MKKLLLSMGLAGSLLFASNANMVDASNLCFKSRMYPVDYDLLFNAVKKRFLDSNMHLKHLSKKDGFIEAEGVKSYDDKIYRFTFTVNFRRLGDVNKMSTLISYELMEKENEVKSVTQFNLPIPIPWSKAFKYKGYTNVIDPKFFDTFYLNFDKTLFDMQIKSMKVEIEKTKDKQLLKDLGEEKSFKKVKELNVSKKITKEVIKKVKDLNLTKVRDLNKTKVVKELNLTKVKLEKVNNKKSLEKISKEKLSKKVVEKEVIKKIKANNSKDKGN
jgi:hypothetical protein